MLGDLSLSGLDKAQEICPGDEAKLAREMQSGGKDIFMNLLSSESPPRVFSENKVANRPGELMKQERKAKK